ncbi:hypothetical protein [Echinicola salinicaeni]|uniref:hypothetical protein n=1 Tax=Echinicola salinicaeni TaxID=2762757 RepID=UPI0016484920|nr:hypothetical protein [Echinicola salinicaeni]
MKNVYAKLIHIILILSLVSCSSEENPSSVPKNTSIALSASDAQALQLVTITTDISISETAITGLLGSLPINIQKTGEKELIFMVPAEASTGKQSVSFSIGENIFKTNINIINASEINDPEAFVDNYLSSYFEDNSHYDGMDKSEIELAKADFDQLSLAEKQQAASFIQANSKQLIQLKAELEIYDDLIGNGDPNNRNMGDCNASCRFTQMKKVTLYTIGALAVVQSSAAAAVGIGIVGALDIGLSLITGEKSFLMNKVKSAVSELLSMAYFAQNDLSETTFEYTDGAISNFRIMADPFTFNNKEKVAFSIKMNYRTLNVEDKNLSLPVIGEFIDLYKKLITNYPELGLPDFNEKTESRYVDDFENLSISISRNNMVQVSELTGDTEKFYAIFSTNEKSNQSFGFTLTYEDGFGNQVANEFDASIIYNNASDILIDQSPWELEWEAEPGSGDTYYENLIFKSDSTAIRYTEFNGKGNSSHYYYWNIQRQWENTTAPEGQYYLIMGQNNKLFVYSRVTFLSKSKMIINKEGKEYTYLGKNK